MPLRSIDRKPPPFFRQGTSALTKLVLFSALAICLMAADTRLRLSAPLRAAVSTLLLPVQRMMQVSVRGADAAVGYLRGFQAALAAAEAARVQLVRQSVQLARADVLATENSQLRALLDLRAALNVRVTSAEVLYEAGDLYSRKFFIDRGAQHGIRPGSPVVNEQGVLGQVTGVYPLSSVVTMITDRDAAIPVFNRRSLQRSAAFGGAEGGRAMELRFISANTDVAVGDVLTTSGVDGVYPANLLIGRVSRVDKRSDAGFARVVVAPAAAIEGVRHLLVLEPLGQQLPARPVEPAASAPKAGKAAKDKGRASAASSPNALPPLLELTQPPADGGLPVNVPAPELPANAPVPAATGTTAAPPAAPAASDRSRP